MIQINNGKFTQREREGGNLVRCYTKQLGECLFLLDLWQKESAKPMESRLI